MESEGRQSELWSRLDAVEAELKRLSKTGGLSDRIARLEDAFLLITDIERYGKLQSLLAARDLKAADEETVHVILSEAKESDRENLTPEAVKQFPCSVLQVIDRLWLKYTDNRFGFSVQLKQYQAVGGSLDTAIAQDADMLRKLGERLGWRKNGQWKTIDQANYSVGDPVGCYPVVWWDSPYGAKMMNYFLNRLFTCEL